MRIIIFDTETTGVFSSSLTLEKQPYICQFAAISCELSDGKFSIINKVDQLIKVPVTMPLDCVNVHGITDKILEDKPIFSSVVDKILEEFRLSDVAVAHNINFDKTLVEIELKRMGRDLNFLPEQSFDTMVETKELCNLPGRHGKIKSPRLQELYYFLFNKNFDNAHNAMADVEATYEILKELYLRGIFSPQEPAQASLF